MKSYYYDTEKEKWRKRKWRDDIRRDVRYSSVQLRAYRTKKAAEVLEKDAARKRQNRSKMSEDSLKLARQKNAAAERKRIADLSPKSASNERYWKAKNQRSRRASNPSVIQWIDRYNNTVRMRASRDGKRISCHRLLYKEDILSEEELNSNVSSRKRLRRSPETRRKHAKYEHKRIASMSPSKAAKRKKLRAEQEKERRKAKSETERRAARRKNAERMRRKRSENKAITLPSEPPVRKNFAINWTRGFPPNYYTVIDGNEYVQYRMHAFMI